MLYSVLYENEINRFILTGRPEHTHVVAILFLLSLLVLIKCIWEYTFSTTQ